jgi:hypothetical protein
LSAGTLATNDAMFSPSAGTNSVLYTPGGATQVQVFNGAMFTGSADPDRVGTYRVFANVRVTNSSYDFYAQLKWGQGATNYDRITNPEVYVHTYPFGGAANFTTAPFLIDMGLVSVGNPVGYGPLASSVRAANSPYLSFWARRTGGTGNLHIDYLLYVPADEALAIAQYPLYVAISGGGQTTMGEVADGVNDIAYVTDNGAWPSDQGMATLIGRIPDLYPGVTNRLFIVPGLGRNNQRTRTWGVTISYFPRYLVVPGSTT